jgi:hypothetical protein
LKNVRQSADRSLSPKRTTEPSITGNKSNNSFDGQSIQVTTNTSNNMNINNNNNNNNSNNNNMNINSSSNNSFISTYSHITSTVIGTGNDTRAGTKSAESVRLSAHTASTNADPRAGVDLKVRENERGRGGGARDLYSNINFRL